MLTKRIILVKLFLVLFGVLYFTQFSFSQIKNTKKYFTVNKIQTTKGIKIENERFSEDSLKIFLNQIKKVNQWQSDGFLMASFDSVTQKNDTLTFFLTQGELYKLKQTKFILSNKNSKQIPYTITKEIEVMRLYSGIFLYNKWQKNINKVLNIAENNGFPFARLILDTLYLKTQDLHAQFEVQLGPYIVFDSVRNNGEKILKPFILAKYLQIGVGQPFSQAKLNSSDKILGQLAFVKQDKEYEVKFEDGKASPTFTLKNAKTNQIDGIIGVLPNPKNNNLLITGEANVALRNLFQRSISWKAEWRSFQAESQMFRTTYNHPFIFRSIIEPSFRLDFLKQDSTFRTFEWVIPISAFISSFAKVSVLAGQKNTETLRNQTQVNTNTISGFSDSQFIYYGFNFSYNNTSSLFSPKIGWICFLEGMVGNKKLSGLDKIPLEARKSLNENSLQIKIKFTLEKFFSIKENTILFMKSQLETIQNDQLFLNELNRIGGFKVLRGFNENSFYVSDYFIQTLELRQYTDEDTYFYTFIDAAWYAKRMKSEKYKEDFPLGFGVGTSLATKFGLFNFAYSMGISKEQNIGFNQSKIHFGYITRF